MATMATMDKKIWKKCIKCRLWKRRAPLLDPETYEVIEPKGFGAHADAEDKLQTICMKCKNPMNIKSRNKNVTARVRHHTATRCLTQLGNLAPVGFTKQLEDHLGYRIRMLVRHLGADLKKREGKRRKLVDALNEGYHIDHIHPLSKFPVVGADNIINWVAFKECWSISNLRAIPGEENLKKGAKVA